MPRREETVWNRFAAIYDRFMKKDQTAYKEIIKRIIPSLKPEDRVLEVAAGTGIIALALAKQVRNVEIEAIDFSSAMVAAAEEKAQKLGIPDVKFSVQDACFLPYEAHSFDVVIISNALHVMPDPAKALAEIKRVLKKDGRLIAPTFVHAGNIKAAFLFRLISLTGFRVYHKWTKQSYQIFLEENGFQVVGVELLKASFPLAYVIAQPKNGEGTANNQIE